ncbi:MULTISPECIES: transposase [unclassified Streptomyces]|uniref:transposase n=1 Tax=unclassified Streptomyces TaxID=2593676 RepID=UPI003653A63F
MGADRPAAPDRTGQQGRPFSDARTMVEAIICQCRCGTPWRDLPEVNGPWLAAWI